MSDIGLFADFTSDVLVWFLVTVVIGGPAAVACGRALARAWRGFGRAVHYTAMLAAGVDFLCYALFGVSALPIMRIIEQAAARNYAELPILLSVFVATFAILLAFAYVGWRVTRAGQMRRQYPFLETGSVASSRAR